jgi:hypothetical protein
VTFLLMRRPEIRSIQCVYSHAFRKQSQANTPQVHIYFHACYEYHPSP